MPTAGSLFSGIGGLELGLERAGWTVRWQVEIDPWCRRVLAKHWPDVARYGDVRSIHLEGECPVADAVRGGLVDAAADAAAMGGEEREDEGQEPEARRAPAAADRRCPGCPPYVDLICGGFPCQPVSVAGKRLAQADERWLWPEFARVVRSLRPAVVLVENVPGLLVRGVGDVLGDLATIGYDTE